VRIAGRDATLGMASNIVSGSLKAVLGRIRHAATLRRFGLGSAKTKARASDLNINRGMVAATAVISIVIAGSATAEAKSRSSVISSVDTSLVASERYVLRISGKPFYPTEIQIRLDKLRYWWGWDARARAAIVARAAADGFNTVAIPIHWYEVEPRKDAFDWSVLDEYLALATRHGLKVELLWFGANSGGRAQWLGDPKIRPVHLRTPDYVLYSPAPDSKDTTSEFTIRRDMSPYSLDLADPRLKARETYVLSKVMDHIAAWDAAHGSHKTVTGVQLGNEVVGRGASSDLVVSYLSGIGGAVKHSPYVVWTRMNCIHTSLLSRLAANQKLRQGAGTNIDFVGIDTYRHHLPSDQAFIASMRNNIPEAPANYRMIMEVAAEFPNAAALQLSALSGGSALSFYDMIGPDEHGLYDRAGAEGFQPHGPYVEDVRLLNRLLNSDLADVALKAPGRDLFVHNLDGTSIAPSSGARGVIFTAAVADSRAISIERSAHELVLMNTRGGTFQLPDDVKVVSAAKGYYNGENAWVSKGTVPLAGRSLVAPADATVRVIVVAGRRRR
jgi:hypothetical protein